MKLITGKNGFIGSNLIADVKIGRDECDFTDYSSILQVFKKYSADTVIHTAAKHGSAIEMLKNHTEYVENNILTDINVIKACKESGVENLLMLSTITSFDPKHPSPFTEESINGEVNEKIFGYAYSKKLCAGLCKAYQLDYGLNYKAIFLGNTYGPFGKFHDNATVIHNLIYKFVKAKKENSDVNLFGDGKTIRNYTYVEDLNTIFDKVIVDKTIKNPIIVSNSVQSSILDIVDIIKSHLNFNNNIKFDNTTIVGEQIKVVDTRRLSKIIGEFYFTDLKTGIEKTIDWYIAR